MDIICLSHLKWEETLFQRPQQLMLRMARQGRVLYYASCSAREAVRAKLNGKSHLLRGDIPVGSNALSYRNLPFLPFTRRFPALRSVHLEMVAHAALREAQKLGFVDPLLWVYYPSYVDHIRDIPRSRLVYDCMDHFSGFQHSDQGIAEQEQRLLRQADIVFTGGRSLQRGKEGINPKTWCFPSGVEFEHFQQAACEATPIPEDLRRIPRPILGYFGAIDERIDFELIRFLCRERPQWSIVFLGPMIEGSKPPVEAPNFHYLGKKRYQDLPAYLKGFDVGLMPFVQTELTRHISPTKTPEYLAGGKPVVSTPVPDVIAEYSDIVAIAADHQQFLKAIEWALGDQRPDAQARFIETAKARSWDAIAEEMLRIVRS